MLDILARLEGRRLRKVWVPLPVAKLAMGVGEKLRLPVPVTPGQLSMLQEPNMCDGEAMRHAFGVQPRGFEEGVRPVVMRVGAAKPAPAQ